MSRIALFSALLVFVVSCKLSENIQDGTTAFELKKYGLAAELLQKDFNENDPTADNGNIAYRIALSYLYINNIEQAEKWFKTAMDWEYGPEAMLMYAQTLKRQEKYHEAIKAFNEYLKEEPYRRPEITIEINACESALDWMQADKDEYQKDTYVTALAGLNTAAADFQPVLLEDRLYFTSSRSSATGDNKDSWTGNAFYDIFASTTNYPGRFSSPESYNDKLNLPFNDGSVIFSADGNELFFTRCGTEDMRIDDYCAIYTSVLQEDGTWSEPTEIPFFIDSLNVGSPCLSPDGQTLFFVANYIDSYGGSDIFFSRRMFEGWSEPENAGGSVNTTGNEAFPSFGPDGTFYFSSDGIPGMGGLDLFSAKWENGKFSNVVNLRYPINSGGDDFGMAIDNRALKVGTDTLAIGYFSSSRKGGKGSDDLYMFVRKNKKLPPPVYVMEGRVMRKVYEEPDNPSTPAVDTIPLVNAVAVVGYADINQLLGKYQLNADTAMFRLPIEPGKSYKVTGLSEGFFSASVTVPTDGLKAANGDTLVVYTEVVLDKIPDSEDVEIKLSNIYYDFNDTTLRPESFPELDQLVILLKENPGLVIQINSHTDSRGRDSYNLRLSQGRANSVVVYLIEKGIAPARLVAKGFGETEPDVLAASVTTPFGKSVEKGTRLTEGFINGFRADKEDFEFLHQLNRRTTFRVLSDNFEMESETPDDIRVDEAPDEDEVKDDRPKID